MEIPFNCEGFEGQNLVVKSGGLFSGPKLMMDGQIIKTQKGKYALKDNNGNLAEVKLSFNYIDPIPKVQVNGKAIKLGTPLKWFEYAWICWPILFVFVLGLLVGSLGFWAASINGRIFRGDKGIFAKYCFTGLVSLGPVAVYIIVLIIGYLSINYFP